MSKEKCIDCNKETTSGVNILTGKDWKYEFYCINCARAFFGKLSTNDLSKLTLTQLNQCSYEYDNQVQRDAIEIRDSGQDWSQVPYERAKAVKSCIKSVDELKAKEVLKK